MKESFNPARIFEIELSQPLPDLAEILNQDEKIYTRALILVKIHTQPLGLFEFTIDDINLSAEENVEHIRQQFDRQIRQHLEQDGLYETDDPLVNSMTMEGHPICQKIRQRIIDHAPLVSVVIATRDRTSELAACLDSICAVAYPNFEIIVVDNAPSTNATAELIRNRYSDRTNIRYVREDTPGLAVAHNRGLREVRASMVVFTDDDVLVDAQWLTEIVRAFKISEDVACVTGMILPFEMETPAQDWAEQYGGFCKGYDLRIFDRSDHTPQNPLFPYSAGQFGSGANMAFRTSVLLEMGGFEPSLGAGTPAKGGDDLAAFFNIISSGYKLVYQPAALVYHRHRRDYEGLARQTYGYGIGLVAFLSKVIADQPNRIFDILARLPYGLQYLFSPNSPKNRFKRSDYPATLTRLEREGMLFGGWAYLFSRWKYRNINPRTIELTKPGKQLSVKTPLEEKSH